MRRSRCSRRLALVAVVAAVSVAGAALGARVVGLVGGRDASPRDSAAADSLSDEDPSCVAARIGLPCR